MSEHHPVFCYILFFALHRTVSKHDSHAKNTGTVLISTLSAHIPLQTFSCHTAVNHRCNVILNVIEKMCETQKHVYKN